MADFRFVLSVALIADQNSMYININNVIFCNIFTICVIRYRYCIRYNYIVCSWLVKNGAVVGLDVKVGIELEVNGFVKSGLVVTDVVCGLVVTDVVVVLLLMME